MVFVSSPYVAVVLLVIDGILQGSYHFTPTHVAVVLLACLTVHDALIITLHLLLYVNEARTTPVAMLLSIVASAAVLASTRRQQFPTTWHASMCAGALIHPYNNTQRESKRIK